MRVLTISVDRSRRGVLHPGTDAFKRQEAYARQFGSLDIIGFSLKGDNARFFDNGQLRMYPTNSASRLLYGLDAIRIARKLPKPDIISAQDPFETGFVAWLVARMQNVPLHIQVHTDFLSAAYARHSFLNRTRVWVAGFVLRRASRIRVVSERIKSSIEKQYHLRAPVTVLPIFADVERIHGASPDKELLVRFAAYKTKLLVVSRLESEKNVGLAIRAFARSAPSDTCLIIVGSGSENASLKHFAKRLNVAERVFFDADAEAASYFKFADLVLVPSKYEGYGLVIVEALAAGKPVLSTDVGVAREAGAIVTTEEKFADALAEWFRSGPRTAELKSNPYRNFDEYVCAYCDDIKRCAITQ
ncbi:glycosyltransferase [Candidatus Kaiserbacteria bacterium]|nr:glycosyltransferase [Candidatus Kaiserbacteria bacterium]